MKNSFKVVISLEQDKTMREEIYVTHDNRIEKAVQEKIYEISAMEIADYINKECKYSFDREYAFKCCEDGKKVAEIDKEKAIKNMGKINISEYESVEEFLDDDSKDYQILTPEDGLKDNLELMIGKKVRDLIVPSVKRRLKEKREDILKELKGLDRKALIECISDVLSVEKVIVKEIKENIETKERVEEIVPKKNVEYIDFEKSKIVKNYTDQELLEALYDKIEESPFTYIKLCKDDDLSKIYAQGCKLLSEKDN